MTATNGPPAPKAEKPARKPKAEKKAPKEEKPLEAHPLAEEYPMMPPFELARMEEGMKERGFDPRFPIVMYKGKILDGRNRYAAARAAGVKAVFVEFKGNEEKARAFVKLANEERRHLSPEFLMKRRGDRVQRVAEARAAGKSTRTIAEDEGISQSQVMRDLDAAAATEPIGSVPSTPATVTGRDGKQHAATRPAPAPPPAREPSDDTEAVKKELAEEKGKPKPGSVLFDLREYASDYGALVRQIDRLSKAFGINGEMPEAEGLRRLLGEFDGGFRKYHGRLVREASGGKS